MQIIHCPMILHIYRNLLAGLAVQHREGAPHFDSLRIVGVGRAGAGTDAEECADDSVLVVFAAEVVV